MKKFLKASVSLALAAAMTVSAGISVFADTAMQTRSTLKTDIVAAGSYSNWEGVSNVTQFKDNNGNFCFAYDLDSQVVAAKVDSNGKLTGYVVMTKKHPIFGTVICDKDGNYYVVTGEENKTSNTQKETVFISKYDKNGKHIATVGDNGSSSLASYYDSSFYTKIPFDAGCCSAAINGNILTVNYAREMYNTHQSNSVFSIDISTMKKVDMGVCYNSHSFAQRVIPFKDGFVYASEGDCYNRAFTIYSVDINGNKKTAYGSDIFHFWVRKNALNDGDMRSLNNNFAHMGGLAAINDNKVAFVGTSAKSLNSNAQKEKEQLFIQIFDPFKDLTKSSAYTTSGTRSGTGGNNGNESVTDYGVVWLTDLKDETVSNPQVVSTKDGKIVVLFELKNSKNAFLGTYYMVLDQNGKIITKMTRFSEKAHLDPYIMPISTDAGIFWVGNNNDSSDKNVYINILKLS